MINELGSRTFNNQYNPSALPKGEDYIFIYDKNADGRESVLVRVTEGGLELPKLKELVGGEALRTFVEGEELRIFAEGEEPAATCAEGAADEIGRTDLGRIDLGSVLTYLFSIDEENFFLAGAEFVGKCELEKLALAGWTLESPRIFRLDNPRHLCMAGATANHLHSWYSTSQFCGKCGAKMAHDSSLRMMRCPDCGNMVFPRLNPAVTIALRNGDSLMVSRYANRPGSTGMALLAGFVEIGESLEECVVREVMEEVGMKAVNIQYFGSQPWGFAGNIQIGFFADVEGSTEVVLDTEELASAGFIAREEIPAKADGLSLTQKMIEAFRRGEW